MILREERLSQGSVDETKRIKIRNTEILLKKGSFDIEIVYDGKKLCIFSGPYGESSCSIILYSRDIPNVKSLVSGADKKIFLLDPFKISVFESNKSFSYLVETDIRILYFNPSVDTREVLSYVAKNYQKIDVLVILLDRDYITPEFSSEILRGVRASVTIPLYVYVDDFYVFRDLINYYTQVIRP
ncbi:MAG: hypothetical protein ACP5GI_03055 [Sulfolobales archaeon]